MKYKVCDPKRVLIIEDSELDVALTLSTLEKILPKEKIDVVKDGKEALDYIFRRGKFSDREKGELHFILLDLNLPLVSGVEFLKKIKEDSASRNIPVVVFTASNIEEDIHRCYELGANSYILKPADYNEFQNVIKELGDFWLQRNIAVPV